jgi:hypothetical protein
VLVLATLLTLIAVASTPQHSLVAKDLIGASGGSGPPPRGHIGPEHLIAPNAEEAMAAAIATGAFVEDISQREAAVEVFAGPDGLWTRREWLAPIWFHKGGDGDAASDWTAVDLRLVQGGDGRLEPAALESDISVMLDGSGDTDVVRWAVPGSDVTVVLKAPRTPMPDAIVEGARARYLDIWPGVDLVVDVTNSGFEQYFVLHSREAWAAVAEDLRLDFAVINGMAALDGGGVTIATMDGRAVATVPQAYAWDAVNDTYRQSPVLTPWAAEVDESRGEVPLPDEVRVPMAGTATAEGYSLQLVLDPAWADSTSTKYPIVIDPLYSQSTSTFDTTLTSGSYADDERYALTELLLGKDPSAARVSRPVLKFSTTFMKSVDVTAANLYLWNYWSATCTDLEWQAYRIAPPTTAWNWNNAPSYYSGAAQSWATEGHDSGSNPLCSQAWVSVNLNAFVAIWKADTANDQGLLLRAGDEGNSAAWKRFYSIDSSSSNKPHIEYTYNQLPGTPTAVAYTPPTSTARGKVSATVTDPDGGTVRALFTAERRPEGSTGDWQVVFDKAEGTLVSSGSSSIREVDLIGGFEYRLTVWGHDSRVSSTASSSAYTFTVPDSSVFQDILPTQDDEVDDA